MRTFFLTLALLLPGLAGADEPVATPKPSVARVMYASSLLRFYAIRPDTALAKAGLMNGDGVSAMNGLAIPDEDFAKAARQKVLGASELQLTVVRRGQTVTVKLTGDALMEFLSIIEKLPASPAPVTTPASAPDPAEVERQKLLDAGIRRIDAGTVELDRTLVDRIFAEPMFAASSARIVPSIKDGKANGFKVYAIRPNSVLARLGFMNGDTVEKVNGLSLSSPDRALEAYSKLKTASVLTVDVVRQGKPVTLVIKVK
jgi:general secretion pathway protein C